MSKIAEELKRIPVGAVQPDWAEYFGCAAPIIDTWKDLEKPKAVEGSLPKEAGSASPTPETSNKKAA